MSATDPGRDQAERQRSAQGSIKIDGSELVVGVCVDGPKDENGARPYRMWVRGPATGHTNGEMIECLAMLATTITFGNAQGGRISLQQSIDYTKEVFAAALQRFSHEQVARGIALDHLTTEKMHRAPSPAAEEQAPDVGDQR